MARSDDWATPAWLFEKLDDEFRFDLDAAASDWNAKCSTYLTDALGSSPWPGSVVFLNPPYARGLLIQFLRRAAAEADAGKTVVALVPVRTDTDWWHDLVLGHAAEIRFVRRRVGFIPPPGHDYGPSNRPLYASAVVVYQPGSVATVVASSLAGRPIRKADWLPAHSGQGQLPTPKQLLFDR